MIFAVHYKKQLYCFFRSVDDKEDSSRSPVVNDKREKRRSEKRERDRRESEKTRDDSDSNMSNPTPEVVPLQNGPGLAAASNMWGGMMGNEKFNEEVYNCSTLIYLLIVFRYGLSSSWNEYDC